MEHFKSEYHRGLRFAVSSYLIWGLVPAFWKYLSHVPASTILAYRILWGGVFFWGLHILGRSRGQGNKSIGHRLGFPIFLSTLLISANWGVYVWAVLNGHVLEASLGYFLNPLFNIVFGLLFFKEHLSRARKIAIGFALLGIGGPLLKASSTFGLTLAVFLGASFGLYGVVRKSMKGDPLRSSAMECLIAAPFALVSLLITGAISSLDLSTHLLLALGGIVTGAPLLFFVLAAKRIELSTMGLIQFISPICQMVLALLLFGEAWSVERTFTFGLIWIALGFVVWDLIYQNKTRRVMAS